MLKKHFHTILFFLTTLGITSLHAAGKGFLLHTIEGNDGPFRSVAFTSNDEYIVSASEYGAIHTWDPNTGDKPKKDYIFSKESDNLMITRGIAVTSANHIVSVSNKIVSASNSSNNNNEVHIRMWNPYKSSKYQAKKLKSPQTKVLSVAESGNLVENITSYIVSGHVDGTICIWKQDVTTRVVEENFKSFKGADKAVNSVAVTRPRDVESNRYIVGGCSDRNIYIWDPEEPNPVVTRLEGHTGAVRSVAIFEDENNKKYIVSGSYDKTIRIWDFKEHKQVGQPLTGHTSSVNSVAVASGGTYHVVGDPDNAEVIRRDTYIVSGSSDGSIRIWDFNTHQQVGVFGPLKGASEVHSVAVTSNNTYIVSAHGALRDNGWWDNTIRIWDLEKLIELHKKDKGKHKLDNNGQDDESITSENTEEVQNDTKSTQNSDSDNEQTGKHKGRKGSLTLENQSSNKNKFNYAVYLNNPTYRYFIVAILICGGGWWIYDKVLRELLFPSSIK